MKKFAALAAGAALCLPLAACGGAQPGGGADAGDAAATAWALTGGAEPAFRVAFAEWDAENPEKKIAVDWFANDAFKEKIRTAVGAGNAPTLVYNWTGGTLRDYVANGIVEPITDTTKELQEKLFDSVIEAGKVDGELYAVPNNQSQPAILYYNKQLFEEYNLAVPTTWDEFVKAIETFKGEGIIPVALAGQSQWPELMWIQYLTDRIGGPEVFQAVMANEPDAWSHPAITEALVKIQELVDMGAFGDSFGSVGADNGGDTALVHTGQAAMVLQGSWVYPNFIKDAPEFVNSGALGYMNFPAIEGGAGDPNNIVGNPANFWSLSANATDEEKAVALEYLNKMNLNDAYIDELFKIGAVPPVKGLEDRIAQLDDSDYLTFVYEMVKVAPHFQLSWDQALSSAQGQELLTNLSQIFLGQITPDQFVSNMNATIQ
ncbi:MAG: extracellular solute-binding protein [Actinomycetaceae bacterium]|nr:extracellular solute-binding protein [Actinomycetaceae bacterium]